MIWTMLLVFCQLLQMLFNPVYFYGYLNNKKLQASFDEINDFSSQYYLLLITWYGIVFLYKRRRPERGKGKVKETRCRAQRWREGEMKEQLQKTNAERKRKWRSDVSVKYSGTKLEIYRINYEMVLFHLTITDCQNNRCHWTSVQSWALESWGHDYSGKRRTEK